MLATATTDLPNEVRDVILAAAERVFADRGYEGATTRGIAEAAGVSLALIHYHHGGKEQLFEACFLRRAEQIKARRRLMLEGVLSRPRPDLSAVAEAFIRPAIELARGRDGAPHYARMLAVVASGVDARSRALTSRQFDDIARIFIAAYRRALPDLDMAQATRGYLFATAISVSMMAATGRAADLSGDAGIDDDVEALIGQAVAFITAGLQTLGAGQADRAEQPTQDQPEEMT